MHLIGRGGMQHLFPYGHILYAQMADCNSIVLFFATHNVALRGRNLEKIFLAVKGMTAATICVVQEKPDSKAPQVTDIVVREHDELRGSQTSEGAADNAG